MQPVGGDPLYAFRIIDVVDYDGDISSLDFIVGECFVLRCG